MRWQYQVFDGPLEAGHKEGKIYRRLVCFALVITSHSGWMCEVLYKSWSQSYIDSNVLASKLYKCTIEVCISTKTINDLVFTIKSNFPPLWNLLDQKILFYKDWLNMLKYLCVSEQNTFFLEGFFLSCARILLRSDRALAGRLSRSSCVNLLSIFSFQAFLKNNH